MIAILPLVWNEDDEHKILLIFMKSHLIFWKVISIHRKQEETFIIFLYNLSLIGIFYFFYFELAFIILSWDHVYSICIVFISTNMKFVYITSFGFVNSRYPFVFKCVCILVLLGPQLTTLHNIFLTIPDDRCLEYFLFKSETSVKILWDNLLYFERKGLSDFIFYAL